MINFYIVTSALIFKFINDSKNIYLKYYEKQEKYSCGLLGFKITFLEAYTNKQIIR